LTESQT